MEKAIADLRDLVAGKVRQAGPTHLGHCLHALLDCLKRDPRDADDSLEGLLFEVLKFREGSVCVINSRVLALCFVKFYKSRSLPFWAFVGAVTEEIEKFRPPAIVVLGVMARQIGDGFKSQLPLLISKLMACTNVKVQPYICQCFRRILKGTGNFLTGSIGDIYQFVTKKISSESEPLCVECVRTVPVLFSQGRIEFAKLIGIIKISLTTSSRVLRYAAAKSFAKLLRAMPVAGQASVLEEPMAMLMKSIEGEKQVKCVASTFPILIRFYSPILLVEHAKFFGKVLLDLATLPISVSSMALLTDALIDGLVRCAGDTICGPICSALLDGIQNEPFTAGKAIIALCSMLRHPLPVKVYATAGRVFYPLLTTDRKEIRKLAVYFFVVMAHNELHKSRIFFNTFVDFLCDKITSISQDEIDGFARAIATLLVVERFSYEKILPAAIQWLENPSQQIRDIAFLILAAIYKRSNGKALSQENMTLAMNTAKTVLTAADQNSLKLLSCFLLQVVREADKEQWRDAFSLYIDTVLANAEGQSVVTLVVFWRVLRTAQFLWENRPDIPVSMSKLSIQLVKQIFTAEIAETIHPYDGSVDILGVLYDVDICHVAPKRIDSAVRTCFDYLLDCSPTCPAQKSVTLMKDVLNDFPTWVSLISDTATKASIVTELFSSLRTHPLQALALVRSLLSRRKIARFLPGDGLPIFMSFESKPLIVARYAAFCVGKWLKLFPSLFQGCLDYLERQERNQNFVAFVLGECARIVDDPVRCLMKLHQMLQKQQMTTAFNGILAYLKYGKIDASIRSITEDVLLSCCFSDKMRYIPALSLCVKCLGYCDRIDSTVISNFLDFDTCRNYACYLGLSLLKKSSQSVDASDILNRIQTATTPPRLFIKSLQCTGVSEDLAWQFMLLQQTGCESVAQIILQFVDRKPDTKIWTDLCKRIVINNCVPPAERQGDVRIIPTRSVLIAAMEVTVKLVTKIKERFPLELNCVDDLVSIAFTAIDMHDRSIDYHCFAILAAVICTFSDVRNKEDSLLNIYTAQFHPMLTHALDGTRPLRSVVAFCTAYIDFLEDTHNVLLQEALETVVEGISKITLNSDNFVFFCRIAARVCQAPCFDRVQSKFITATTFFFEQVAKQKVCLRDVDKQLPDLAAVYLGVPEAKRKISNSHFILLLLEELSNNFTSPVLLALANSLSFCNITEEQAEFALTLLSAHKDSLSSHSTNVQTQTDLSESDLDATTFWIVPAKEHNPCKTLLFAICQKIPPGQWPKARGYALTLSLDRPFSYSSLACLFKLGGDDVVRIGPAVVASVLEDSDACEAFFVCFFKCVESRVSDGVLSFIANSELPISRKFAILRHGIVQFSEFKLTSLKGIAELVSSVVIPDGLAFVSSLLLEQKTVAIALNILSFGVLEAVVNSMVKSMRSLPRIMHFLSLVCKKVIEVGANNSEFQNAIISVVFVALKLTSNHADRTPVVAPAVGILKMIDPEIIKERWASERNQEQIVKCLTPPENRMKNSIQLKVFSDVQSRKSASGTGWQSLDYED